jgi:hypothetical protein
MLIAAHHSAGDRSTIFAFGIAGILMLVIDAAALTWVALLMALTVKNPNFASVSTIFRVMILPWILFGAIVAILGAAAVLTRVDGPGWGFYLHLWFWLGLATDLAFALPAWHRVKTHFRQLAFQRLASAAAKG